MSSFVLGLHGGWGARFSMLGAASLSTGGSDLPSFQELLVRTHEITEIEKGLYRAEVRR